MKLVYLITHPNVVINPEVPVPQWPLSERGQQRMKQLLSQPWIDNIGSIYSSAEQKAMDGARILAEHLAMEFDVINDLGEIDRSSTGYLPRTEHQIAADKLFRFPNQSIRGWETALAAQQRMVKAIHTLIENDKSTGDIAIVSHGGVAALYLCYLKACPIDRGYEQPGTKGGNYYCFEAQSKLLVHGWQPIDP